MPRSAHILGDFNSQPDCHLPREYFEARDCWVDCRIRDMLHIDAGANIGWCCNLVVMTHNVQPGYFGDLQGRPIWIAKDAFIGGFVTLYNCHIEEGAIVAIGSVVRSQTVAARTMVAGNPARVIARFRNGQWDYVASQRRED